jgi:hypothetical protein
MYYPFHNTNTQITTVVTGSRGSWQGCARVGVSPKSDNARPGQAAVDSLGVVDANI